MITLDRLEKKLDTLAENHKATFALLDALGESQGKLLAAIHEETERGNKLTAERMDKQWEKILSFERNCADAIRLLGGRMDARLDAIGGVLAELLAPRKSAMREECPEKGPKGFYCTKALGHEGKHVAGCGYGEIAETWGRKKAKGKHR